MGQTLITEILVCIIAAWVLAVVFNALKQPVLLAYLAAGFALGPHGFSVVTDHEAMDVVSSLGLMLLLFMIGLEIDLKKIVSAGRDITRTGVVQILGSCGLAMVFCVVLGPATGWLEGLYLGVAIALSSTVIIVKILHDKRELETWAGRLTLGVLVLQDLFAILFLAIQPDLKHPTLALVALSFGRVGLLMAVAFLVSRHVLPAVFRSVALLPELVLVGALAWCFALASLAHGLGLSREMGALAAGVALSTFPYTIDVAAKLTGIRDFFVTLFFVTLGMGFPRATGLDLAWAVVLSSLLVITRLVTVFVPLYAARAGHRGALLPAISLAQMSELSLVLLSLGHAAGDVSESVLARAGFAFVLTGVLSTYGIFQTEAIVRAVSPWLSRLGLSDLKRAADISSREGRAPAIFLLGFSWTASSLLDRIRRERPTLIENLRVVDFNPLVYQRLHRMGVSVVYGDITQPEVLHHAGAQHARVLICSVPNTLLKGSDNLALTRRLRKLNPTAQIIMNAERLADIPALYEAGAQYVTAPRLLEAGEILDAMEAAEKGLLAERRNQQAEILRDRGEILA
ncbi:MAG TPA: cation:proton antiporter [Verrucomicrobiota bacterium]|nr:cation:proton antiporter [Verrucomicrobiota bacterium]HRZ39063.1 cation:proton antiporter [Candidatus Paceibacterota bacterium]HRZ56324.1 cation:proton antiporter [Candidatus Paceibacterota bacterium]